MANQTKKLSPVELSKLDIIENPSGFWVFGSKDENGKMTSGRYSLDKLMDYARSLQLERRISLKMETSNTELFIGEAMTIYRVDTRNVKSLTINGTKYTDLNNKKINKEIASGTIVTFDIEWSTTDSKAYLFIYALATVK